MAVLVCKLYKLATVALTIAVVGWPLVKCDGSADSCSGTPITNRMTFHQPGAAPDQQIHHTSMPITLPGGFKVANGPLGIEKYNDAALWKTLNRAGEPWARGTVDTQFSLPNGTSDGWSTRTTALHDNFADGLDGSRFGVLKQKGSRAANIDVVTDTVNGVKKNVVRLKATADGGRVKSAAVLQTTDLFASGRYEVVARFPPVKGIHRSSHVCLCSADVQCAQALCSLCGLSTMSITLTRHTCHQDKRMHSTSPTCPGQLHFSFCTVTHCHTEA